MDENVDKIILEIRELIKSLNSIADKINENFENVGEKYCTDSLRECAKKYQDIIFKLQNQANNK